MEDKELRVLQLLAKESGISLEKIQNGNLTSDEWINLTSTAAKLMDYDYDSLPKE